MSRKYAVIITISCLTLIAVVLLVGFVPQKREHSLRRKADMTIATMRPEDMPASAPDDLSNLPSWQAFGKVTLPQNSIDSIENTNTNKSQITFSDDSVFLSTKLGPKLITTEANNTTFNKILIDNAEQNGVPLVSTMPASFGEALDNNGRPERFNLNKIDLNPKCLVNYNINAKDDNQSIENINLRAEQSFSGLDLFEKAKRYKDLIQQYAARYNLNKELIYAIIHNESNFSPVLISNRSAMGLMQLLPSTAGGEVHKFIFGHTGAIGSAELSDPAQNIRFGTAYLHLLLNRHLGEIENKTSREYCAIAAYNMGPNRLLRIFDTDREKALDIINAMTPEEVYTRLTLGQPIMETRFFVARVVRSKGEFAAFASAEN